MVNKKLEKTREFVDQKISQYQYIDYCIIFEFDRFTDREDFNDRFNQTHLKAVMNTDYTFKFFQDLVKTIKIGSNVIIFIFGPRNMGKSEVAQSISFYWKKQFKLIKKRIVDIPVGFSTSQMLKIFSRMNPGDLATRDESPDEQGEGSGNAKKQLNNIINITRGYQVSFIFINPVLINAGDVDFYLEVAGKDWNGRMNRCILYDRKLNVKGPVYFKLHDDEEYRKAYKIKKNSNIKAILERAGISAPEIDSERFLHDINELTTFCRSKGVTKKNSIDSKRIRYNAQFKEDESGKKILGSNSYIKKVIQEVWDNLKSKKDIEIENNEQETITNDVENEILDSIQKSKFKYTWKEIHELIKKNKNWPKFQMHLEIYKDLEKGVLPTILAKKHGIHYTYVSKIKKKIEGAISYYGGHLFEKRLYSFLNNTLDRKRYKVSLDGKKSQPDLWIEDLENDELWVFSLKFIKINKNFYYLSPEDVFPEVDFAKKEYFKHKIVKLHIISHDYFNEGIVMVPLLIKELDRETIKVPCYSPKKMLKS